MAAPSKDKDKPNPVIALNKRARHEYFIEENFEAGMALQGWEVKSLRAGKAQITEGYVLIKGGEAWLIGAHFSPLKTTSTHVVADPTRTRKLLLHRRELDRLVGAVGARATPWCRSSSTGARARSSSKSGSPRASRLTTSGPPRRSRLGAEKARLLRRRWQKRIADSEKARMAGVPALITIRYPLSAIRFPLLSPAPPLH
jgi:hypothetical protein